MSTVRRAIGATVLPLHRGVPRLCNERPGRVRSAAGPECSPYRQARTVCMKNRHAPPRRQVRRAKPTRIYRFTAPPLTTSSPLLGTSAMQTVVEPIAMNLTMAAPELGASVLRQLHRFKALPLETAPLSPSEEPERVHHLKARGIGQLPAKRPGRRSHTKAEEEQAIAKWKIQFAGKSPTQKESANFLKGVIGPGARGLARRIHHEYRSSLGLRSKRPKLF